MPKQSCRILIEEEWQELLYCFECDCPIDETCDFMVHPLHDNRYVCGCCYADQQRKKEMVLGFI